jgi:type I restriction enzyme S subunit
MMSGKMYRFRPHPDVMHPKYLTYFIQTRACQIEIDRMKTGISDSGLNLTHDRFATLKIPVPPLNEQHRIVAKIEELFSELEGGVESLTTAQEQLKAYRQAVLKNAFEGKLTASWRIARGVVERTKSASTIPLQEQEQEHLAQLPNDWEYVRLDELTDPERSITYGVIKLGADVEKGVPTLRSSDVRKLRIDLTSVKRISPEIAGQFRRTFLKGGEVLITVRGTLGGVALVPSSLSGWNISREVAMIAPTHDLDPNYLQYMLASPQLEAWFKTRLRGVAYTGINLETVREAPVILPSIEEQHEIASLIEEKMSVIDALEQDIKQQREKIDVLQQAVLKSAFSGKLVMQNSNDEPAVIALKRVNGAETEKNNAKKKNGKKKAA